MNPCWYVKELENSNLRSSSARKCSPLVLRLKVSEMRLMNDSWSIEAEIKWMVILGWDEWNAQLTWSSQLGFVSRGRWVSGSRSLRKTRPPRPVLGGGSVTLPGTRVILTDCRHGSWVRIQEERIRSYLTLHATLLLPNNHRPYFHLLHVSSHPVRRVSTRG